MEINITSGYQHTVSGSAYNEYTLIYTIKTWIYRIVAPIVLILGTFGNIMIILILRRLGSGTTHLFLRALAVSDLTLMYIGLLGHWVFNTFNFDYAVVHDIICKLLSFGQYSSGVLSAWLVVAMTVQRALSVVWPHRVAILCTHKKTFLLIVGITCFVLVLHSHLLYGFKVVSFSNSTSPSCTVGSVQYFRFMTIVWSWVDLFIFSFLPFTCLFVSNIVLMWKLKASMNKMFLTAVQSEQNVNREKKVSSITVTLIAVSMTFFVLSLPSSIFVIIDPYVLAEKSETDVMFRALVNLIQHITLLLWYSNSSFNFYIYCLTGSKFRAEMKKILFGCFRQSSNLEMFRMQNTGTSNISNTTNRVNVHDANEEF